MHKIVDIHCSSLARAMACKGSLFFQGLDRSEGNDAAREGTAAGEYLEKLLTRPGQEIIDRAAKNGVEFSHDIRFYTSEIAQDIFKNAATPILCEQKIDWVTRSGIIIAGQYDASYVGHDGKLYVEDLKFGWVIVDVKRNWQLIGYAIGEIIRRQQAFERIVLRIRQPRPHHEDGPMREWELTYDQLLELKEEIELQMEALVRGEKQLTTGKQCKYCPAAGEACPAFNRMFYAGVDYVLDHHQQDHISDKELAFQMSLVQRVSEVMKIKSDSLKDLAVNRIKNGGIIPGWTTEESYGDRAWKKKVSPTVIEALTGINVTETKMLSPAQAEKMGVPKDLVAKYVDRYFLGMKLVPKDAGKLADKIFNTKKEV